MGLSWPHYYRAFTQPTKVSRDTQTQLFSWRNCTQPMSNNKINYDPGIYTDACRILKKALQTVNRNNKDETKAFLSMKLRRIPREIKISRASKGFDIQAPALWRVCHGKHKYDGTTMLGNLCAFVFHREIPASSKWLGGPCPDRVRTGISKISFKTDILPATIFSVTSLLSLLSASSHVPNSSVLDSWFSVHVIKNATFRELVYAIVRTVQNRLVV